MSIFVTGAGGFIGRAVIRRLTEQAFQIRALGRDRSDLPASVAFSSLDLRGDDGWAGIPWDECTGVIHLAAAGVKQASRSLSDAVAVNVTGTQRLLDQLDAVSPAIPVIFTRTYYEDYLDRIPAFRENVYVVTKAAGTDLMKIWARRHPDRKVAAATIFQAYGAGDDPRNVLPHVVQGIRNKQRIQLGSGRAEKRLDPRGRRGLGLVRASLISASRLERMGCGHRYAALRALGGRAIG